MVDRRPGEWSTSQRGFHDRCAIDSDGLPRRHTRHDAGMSVRTTGGRFSALAVACAAAMATTVGCTEGDSDLNWRLQARFANMGSRGTAAIVQSTDEHTAA